jgi:hypothetical protein
MFSTKVFLKKISNLRTQKVPFTLFEKLKPVQYQKVLEKGTIVSTKSAKICEICGRSDFLEVKSFY